MVSFATRGPVGDADRSPQLLRHPLYAWLGLRPPFGQHTPAEHAVFEKWARGRKRLVEIGVAEGVSALALRSAMSADGVLYLIEPYHMSRIKRLNFQKRAAHKAIDRCPRGAVHWLEQFSHDAVRGWKTSLDLLFIDGDHTPAAVERDWRDWNGFVDPDGVVIFHDARLFEGGWTSPTDGPVQLIDRLFRSGAAPGWKIVEEVDSVVVIKRG